VPSAPRGLGIPPTTATHHPKVDAYMWINRPGGTRFGLFRRYSVRQLAGDGYR
jgi:cellulase/cellobiase CelA1